MQQHHLGGGGGAAAPSSRPGSGAARFITPTQGLSCRQGQSLQSNLENVGGRFLIQTQMAKHKERMRSIRSVIAIDPPWGHEPSSSSGAAGNASRVARRLIVDQQHGTNGGSGLALGRPATAGSHRSGSGHRLGGAPSDATTTTTLTKPPPPTAAAPRFDVTALSAEHQAVYREAVRMLSEMPDDDSRSLLQQLYADAEERRLLDQYSGILPKMSREESS